MAVDVREGHQMRMVTRHVILPVLPTGLIVALYFTPVALIGCANRGLIALAVVLGALIAGVVMTVIAIRLRLRDRQQSGWWALSAVILTVPALLVLGPLR